MKECFHDFCVENKVRELFSNEEVEKIMPYFEKVKLVYCENHVPRKKKIHKNLAKYFFYSEFRRMYKEISMKKEINSTENFSKVRTYFSHIISLFKDLYEDCPEI